MVYDMDIDREPRGIKRKPDDSLSNAMAESMDIVHERQSAQTKSNTPSLTVTAPRRIKALDPDVVNKIAAGEIIVAPVHALKELIENAVDAGSTSLEILVKDGGLKLLQITDNGSGISKEDLPILCHRHTTSKLKSFDDLQSINTYGFRGEALASISHIAHLTITTKTADSNCAWRAIYAACELAPSKSGGSADPKPTAGRKGTQITVEDLFFNMPTRRRAFRSASEEFNKILDVVGRYAIHCTGVAFSCKKHGESSTSLTTQSTASTVDCIRTIYGSTIANELIEFGVENVKYGFKASGFTTNANYHVKKTVIIIFINHRLVESTNIKKAVETTYATFLPKGGHPFIYLDLEIEPHRVDVNVHPTKREVNFLYEDEILELVCNTIRMKLASVDTSRNFVAQGVLPELRAPMATIGNDTAADNASTQKSTAANKPHENNLIRTDTNLRKITTMLPLVSRASLDAAGNPADMTDPDYTYTDKQPVICRLMTVKELRSEVRDSMHNELTELFASHTFVGIVDEQRRLAAIQGGVKLYIVNYGTVAAEYFYQVGLTDFGNFGTIKFEPPLNLKSLLRLAADLEKERRSEENIDVEQIVNLVYDQLVARRAMLLEYFSLNISEAGELISIPLLLKGYTPSLGKLPQFLLHLGPKVNWFSEKECFETFLRQLAEYYAPECLPATPGPGVAERVEVGADIIARREFIRKVVEQKLFPAFKSRLVATNALTKGKAVVEVANLKGLYKVFERC